jgi:hypothetical protein
MSEESDSAKAWWPADLLHAFRADGLLPDTAAAGAAGVESCARAWRKPWVRSLPLGLRKPAPFIDQTLQLFRFPPAMLIFAFNELFAGESLLIVWLVVLSCIHLITRTLPGLPKKLSKIELCSYAGTSPR